MSPRWVEKPFNANAWREHRDRAMELRRSQTHLFEDDLGEGRKLRGFHGPVPTPGSSNPSTSARMYQVLWFGPDSEQPPGMEHPGVFVVVPIPQIKMHMVGWMFFKASATQTFLKEVFGKDHEIPSLEN